MAIAALYLFGPFGHDITLAFSLTIESNPVERIAPNHSPSTRPKSIGRGVECMTASRSESISVSDQPNVRTKSLPVPAGIIAKGIWAGVTFCKTRCINPSPPTAITPLQSGYLSKKLQSNSDWSIWFLPMMISWEILWELRYPATYVPSVAPFP